MCRIQAVVALLALCVVLVHSFSWDIVVARSNQLEFYNEGALAHTARPASHRIKWITYDPVHDRVLFTETYNKDDSASSFDIATKTSQSLIKKKPNRYLTRFAYDPATELFFGFVSKSIYSFPLGSGNNNDVNGDLVITLETIPRELAVDSCGGYIYWTSNNIIERALFNGSDREVIIDNDVIIKQGLTIDTKTIYWIEEHNDGGFSIESADLNGMNRKTLYSDTESDLTPAKLTVSKDFISWPDSIEKFFWQLPKDPPNGKDVKPSKIATTSTLSFGSQDIAANYKIEERTQGGIYCNALTSLLPDKHNCQSASANESLFCVYGTQVSEEPRCECAQGYTGERCDISVCHNYCLQGDCSVSNSSQPKCRCNSGFTGVRCDVSVCENYCFQGECSVSAGQPKCSCNAGYSGDRCEINACHKYCLNSGVCSLNKSSEPVCQCTGQYEGERCDVPVFLVKCLQTVTFLKDTLSSDMTPDTLGIELNSTCASTVV